MLALSTTSSAVADYIASRVSTKMQDHGMRQGGMPDRQRGTWTFLVHMVLLWPEQTRLQNLTSTQLGKVLHPDCPTCNASHQ